MRKENEKREELSRKLAIELEADEDISEEALKELTNGKGDDEDEQ